MWFLWPWVLRPRPHLYLRAADNSTQTDTRQVLLRIAEEERTHLKLLGDLLDQQGDNV